MNSSETFRTLLEEGKTTIHFCGFLGESPQPLPVDFNFDRIEGMMLGLAIGDALGNGIERLDWYRRKSRFGEVRDYVQRPGYPDDRGYPSDDSQMAFWTLEQALRDGRFVPEALLELFCTREIRGIGATVLQALTKRRCGFAWQECGILLCRERRFDAHRADPDSASPCALLGLVDRRGALHLAHP